MNVAGRDECVYPCALSALERLGRSLDILVDRPREPADDRLSDFLGYEMDSIKAPLARDGKTCLDDIDAEALKLLRYHKLLLQRE